MGETHADTCTAFSCPIQLPFDHTDAQGRVVDANEFRLIDLGALCLLGTSRLVCIRVETRSAMECHLMAEIRRC
jgi:hypothetical protein